MTVIDLESKKDYDHLIANTPVVFVMAHANYAASSKAFRPEYRDLAAEHSIDGKFVFAMFDAFDADDINADLLVRQFPAYFIFKEGQKVKDIYSSNVTKQQLEADIKDHKPA